MMSRIYVIASFIFNIGYIGYHLQDFSLHPEISYLFIISILACVILSNND